MSYFRQDVAQDTNQGGLMSAEPAVMESSGVAREPRSPMVARFVQYSSNIAINLELK